MDSIGELSRQLSAARAHLDRGFLFEQAGTLERALEAYRDALAACTTPREEADTRLRIARVYRALADWDRSRSESRHAIRIAEESGDPDLAAEAMNVEIGALQMQGRFDEADAIALTALSRATSPRVRGITLQNLGRSAAERRDFAASDRYFDESIAAFRDANYEVGLAVALSNAARAALDRGDTARSIQIGYEAIDICRRINALDVLSTSVQNQAAAHVANRDLDAAEALLTEALGHFTTVRNPVRQAEALEIMGDISHTRGDRETASRCYARARELATAANDQRLIERVTRKRAGVDERAAGE
jgi:tetratricopeptide (TPR) repeat protein